jgi:hypothetical protein
MALGGGNFTSQNKVLPGSYINFVGAATASAALSDRGIVAVGLSMDWGNESGIFELNAADVAANSLKTFGYQYTDPLMKDVRELFDHAKKVYAYRLNGGGVKATATIGALVATAKYAGTRGNAIKIVITANVITPANFDVKTYVGTDLVDTQTNVVNIAGLVANDFVTFNASGILTLTAGTNLATGTNITVTGTQHTAFLAVAESYAFNTMVCATTDAPTIALYVAYVKRRRDDNGVKFQVVVYQTASDYEGVISVENAVTDAGANAWSLVYWVGGIAASVGINQSNTNQKYDGEYSVNTSYTQTQLEANITAGKFMFHRNVDTVRILTDINTLVTTTASKTTSFKSNQTIRVIDQIANDIAVLFNNKYLGQIPNDASGRISFWGDVVAHHNELQRIRAIENFKSSDVVITLGSTKKSVVVSDVVTVVNAMEQLYMTTIVQ